MPAIGLVVVLACAFASAQTTAPAVRDPIERQPIGNRSTTRPASAVNAPQQGRDSWTDAPRVILALGIVLGIIFGLKWLGKRYFPSLTGGRAAGVVRVLARSPVTPRQQVLLVQVGKRVLVVADNGSQMNALANISDPDEVASLLGQLEVRPEPPAEPFTDKLDAAESRFETPANRFEQDSAEEPVESALGEPASVESPASEEITGLMEKVRALAKQLGRS